MKFPSLRRQVMTTTTDTTLRYPRAPEASYIFQLHYSIPTYIWNKNASFGTGKNVTGTGTWPRLDYPLYHDDTSLIHIASVARGQAQSWK